MSDEQLDNIELVWHESRLARVEHVMHQIQPSVELFIDQVEEAVEDLAPYVDSVAVQISDNRPDAFKRFLRTCAQDVIVVDSLKQISPKSADQLEIILLARGDTQWPNVFEKRILILSIEQKSLLKLDLDMAFELQEDWIIAPLRKAIDDSLGKAEDNYIRLRDLMLERLTVEKIAERLGQSKSTIFRWRKQFEDRLAVDVPGFKKGS
jgi:hypothetical protein